MTNVFIHGILGKKFGTSIKLRVGNIKSIVAAIDSMKQGFRKELCQLFHEKICYEVVINKEKQNEIHFIPYIAGAGSGGWKILGYVLQVIAFVLYFVPGFQGLALWIQITVQTTIATLGALSTAYGTKLETMAKIQAFYAQLAEQMKNANKDKHSGGGTKLIGGAGASYLFSNEVNFNTQGQIVRVGYGKMKAGTNTISVSIKNNPTNVSLEDYVSSISSNTMPLYD
jgi:predicted phage tail protein